ncbi:MAG TPA: hypothetical protein VNN73_00885 [Blastocatellia bacterium]|nr:hypothetical protein [Blastocatellia bacterium]
MHQKKILLIAILLATLIGVGIITFINGRGNSSAASGEVAATQSAIESLDETSAEVRVTLPFFHRLNATLMRGGEPLRGSIEVLKRLGVRSIVDLRSIYDHTNEIGEAVASAGLQYHWLPMSVWNPPTDDEANKFISLVMDESQGPFYVFCADGANRTGEMAAIYRIAHDGWTVERALKEMDEFGFNPYYYTLRNYVWTYARKFRPLSVPREGRRLSSFEQ